MTPALRFHDVSKRFRRQDALKGVSLEVQPGDIYGLLGLNGAGKTTLIKSMLRLMRPDSGEIHIFGRDAAHPASRASLFYLPEKFNPSPALTGYTLLELTLAAYGLPLDRGQADAQALALGLTPEQLKRRIRGYSKGMGQKLGLLAAFLCRRPLLVLDEPVSGLDPEARLRLRAAIQAYKAEDKAIFFTTHLLGDVEALCNKIGILHGGRLIFDGTIDACKARYQGATLEAAFLAAIQAEGHTQAA